MKKQMKNYIRNGWLLMSALTLVFLASCNEDEPEPKEVVASFQFELGKTNFLEVTFTNFSQNATTYAWDFGDGETSNEENPVHSYAAADTYEVKLTATNDAGESATRTQSITLSDPDEELTKLAGVESKTWILQREGVVLGIGPAGGDTQWWSFGGVTPHGDRPCILDDEYTFNRADLSFDKNTNGTLFTDGTGNGGWNNTVPDVCNSESTVDWMSEGSIDMSAYKNGGDYTFELSSNTLTISGDGVYIGLANKTNAGDIGTAQSPQNKIVYSIIKLVDHDDVDSLQLAMQVDGGDVYWSFFLVHYDDASLMPPIPSAEPRAAFSSAAENLVVTFTNSSANATSYAWDFGDGGTSTDENPVHTYAEAGDYDVTLTAKDDNGLTSSVTQTVSVSAATYSSEIWASAEGKVWTLAPVAGAFRVGPAIGSGEWFASSADDATARACQYDDEFIFATDGSFTFDSKGAMYGEGFMGVDPAGCVNDGDIGGVYAGFVTSTGYTFATTDATDTDRASVTVTGTGAFLGFNKGYNGGEYNGSDAALQGATTYKIFSYFNDGTVERVDVAVDISAEQNGTAWWTMILEAQ